MIISNVVSHERPPKPIVTCCCRVVHEGMRPPMRKAHPFACLNLFLALFQDDYHILTYNGYAVKRFSLKGQDHYLAILDRVP